MSTCESGCGKEAGDREFTPGHDQSFVRNLTAESEGFYRCARRRNHCNLCMPRRDKAGSSSVRLKCV